MLKKKKGIRQRIRTEKSSSYRTANSSPCQIFCLILTCQLDVTLCTVLDMKVLISRLTTGADKKTMGEMVTAVDEDIKLDPIPTGLSRDNSIDRHGCLPFSLIGIVISIQTRDKLLQMTC